MSRKCRAFSKSKLGLEPADNRKAFYAGWEAALAEPTLQTCNCRWDGEVQVQQCTLHEAHVDAIHEWAERAKTAEKKLAALAEPVAPPEAQTEAEKVAYCAGWWDALAKKREQK